MTDKYTLIKDGNVDYLTDVDLIETMGVDHESSKQLLEEHNIQEISRLPSHLIERYPGIGPKTAAKIVATFELSRRLEIFTKERYPKIRSPSDVYKLLYPKLRGLKQEEIRVLYLNTKNCVILNKTTSVGTLNSNLSHPRETFKTAIELSAASIIVTHNHPSGDSTPSREDIATTRKLVESGKFLGIDVLDHIIIGDGSFTSLKDEGYLN